FAHGKPLRKVRQGELVDALFAEIDKSLDRGKVEVEEEKAREGADWLARIEEENAGELTPERIAQMEAEASDTEPDDFLQPVKAGKRVSLDEEASPTAGRRFTRT
ncbi:MAG TPA: 4-hydroxy-3-methylbut-2-en-1-yl diphosphate synthase, partial [Solirubrobacterales bacterium]|nr:4-hydroxy-3-methylbut-2-en-1-yl diphosphate synthase [Solirubrobacterales bacterium]